MIAERKKTPGDDLTSALLAAEIDGDRLTDEEIMAFLFLMVVAGNETTTKLLGNAAFWGHKNPDQRAAVYSDHSKVPLWVEETLRYDTSSQMLARDVAEDVTIYGTTIPPGDVLLLLPGSANRDDRVFADPDAYRIGREIGSKLVSFGGGAHFCLGAHLARLEARVALTELFSRVRGFEVDEANAVRVHSVNVRGFASPADHRGGPLMPRFEPHPERRPAVVTGASSGIGAATRARAGRTRASRSPSARAGSRGSRSRRADPRRRRRGGRASARPDRRASVEDLCRRRPSTRSARSSRGVQRR